MGTGEVVNAPKRSSLFPAVNAAAQKAGQGVGAPQTKLKNKTVLSDEEREERRKATATAAQAREKAWEERLAKQRAKYEKQEAEKTGNGRAWNEVSPTPVLPPPDAEFLRKQKEAAETLEKSGFNPFQATVSSSMTARSVITNLNIDDTQGGKTNSNPVDIMQRARSQLKSAMKGNDIKTLQVALIEAEKYEVPEVDEARDLLAALSLQESQGEDDDVTLEHVDAAIQLFVESADSPEKKKVAQSTVQTLLRNLVDHPENPKFRKIRLENKVVKEKIVDVAGGSAVAILLAVGFEHATDDDGQTCLGCS